MKIKLKDIKNYRKNGQMVNNLNLIKIENIIVKINRKIIRKLYKIHKMLQNKHYNVIENLKKNILTIDRMHRKNQINYVHKNKN